MANPAANDPQTDHFVNGRAGFSRRRFLATSSSICFAMASKNAMARDPTDVAELDIDCHSHIWTPDTRRYPLKQGTTQQELDPPSFTAGELLAVARRNGVGRVVLIQHHLFYGWDNSYLIDAAREHDGTFAVVGLVDDRLKNPGQQMQRLLNERVCGFRITSWIRGKERWLQGEGMAAMWRTAAETRQAMCCLIDAHDLPAVTRMCRKFPDTPVVVDHFARIGVDGTIRDVDVKTLCGLSQFKNTYVKVSAFYALGKKQPPYTDLIPMIRHVYEAFGPERLMWGSDCPYQLQGENTYRASIDLLRDRLDFLNDGDRRWLLRRTAEKVFFEHLG